MTWARSTYQAGSRTHPWHRVVVAGWDANRLLAVCRPNLLVMHRLRSEQRPDRPAADLCPHCAGGQP